MHRRGFIEFLGGAVLSLTARNSQSLSRRSCWRFE
jgi:hypothetical protein